MEHGGAAVRADYGENRAFGSEAWTMTSKLDTDHREGRAKEKGTKT